MKVVIKKVLPNIKTKNINKELIKIANEYAKEIFSYKEVIGVAVGGGIVRGHSDLLSDIDLYIYLKPNVLNKWHRKIENRCPFPHGCHKWKGYEIETEIYDYNQELKNDWEIEDRWERQYHKVLYDTNNKVKKLLKEKCIWGKNEKKKLFNQVIFRAGWYLDLPLDFVKRGDFISAHYQINKSIEWMLECIFMKNGHFYPWNKWKLHYALLMKKKPVNFDTRIKEGMIIKSFDKKDILRRIKILKKIHEEI
tara:strand:- start:2189 stop:2941 length:753 start_codon:yes stop_codon:yes gene_type:complete